VYAPLLDGFYPGKWAAELTFEYYDPIPDDVLYSSEVRFRCFLGNMEIPIASFEARIRGYGKQSYLSVQVPGHDHVTTVLNNCFGSMLSVWEYCHSGGEEILAVELLQVTVGSVTRTPTGFLMSGHAPGVTGSGLVTIPAATSKGADNWKRQFVIWPHPLIRPGCTVTIDSDVLVAELVTYKAASGFGASLTIVEDLSDSYFGKRA
jgi:hypothetical protein